MNNRIRLIRIAVTGLESTGKSRLAEELAKHYSTVWVPEYAREYIDKLGREYEQNDILKIAKKQIENEVLMNEKANRILFSDTELIVTKVWSEFKYKKCDPWILENIKKYEYDLYLLCDIDIPWEYDPQREHPHLRKYLLDVYTKELEEYNFNYALISGLNEKRLENAIRAIKLKVKS